VPALERPYIVLLDLNLPQMDGFSVLKKIRADPDLCDIPVFALTTSTRDDDKAAAYELGVVAYLPKGLLGEDCEDLVSQVKANWSTVPTHAHTSLRRTFDQSSAR
jgi:CheY-like chemotaxis protein